MLFGFDDPATDATPVASDEPADVEADAPAADSSTGWFWVFGLVGLLLGLTLALLAWTLWGRDQTGLTQDDVDQAVDAALDDRDQSPTPAGAAYDQIAPSLVGIRATWLSDETPANIGSGVVINDQGQILTSHHVVEGADSIELLFPNGSVSQAVIESTDPTLDIAVLSATARTPGVAAVLGNARTLQIGDSVYAVGNPLGLTGSLTAGVISGLDRTLPFPNAEDDDAVLEGLIQFDAAVNQGSSGGPLLNADGEVIGIVTALADPGGQGFFIGIGFAVPIDIAAQRAADGPSQ